MISKTERYFLGANSSDGFASLYADFVNERRGDTLRIIKGGPGCGKSTFMRRMAEYAEANGACVELISCSGDTASLDGIYIKEASLAYVDGTSPHVIEPDLPGAAGSYLDLGFVIRESAGSHRSDIAALFDSYRTAYRRAYDCLHAYSRIDEIDVSCTEEIDAAAMRFAKERLYDHPYFREKKRFLSALTGEGGVTLWESAKSCGEITTLRGSVEDNDAFLRQICAERRRRGGNLVCCLDPIRPAFMQALLLPEEEIVLFAESDAFPSPYVPSLSVGTALPRRKETASVLRAILALSESFLREAKEKHDELEALYRPHLDFSGIEAVLQAEKARMLCLLSVHAERKRKHEG